MAFNGSGLFNRLYNWAVDRDGSIPITATRMDAEMDGVATGLSNCITKDGQTTPTADIPLGGNKLTGVADATTAQDAATFKQLYTTLYPVSTTGGSGGSTSGEDYDVADWPALVTSNVYRARLNVANVGACNIDGTDIKMTQSDGSKYDPPAGNLSAGAHSFYYDGTDLVVIDPVIWDSTFSVTSTEMTVPDKVSFKSDPDSYMAVDAGGIDFYFGNSFRFKAHSTSGIEVDERIRFSGDSDTYIDHNTNEIRFVAGSGGDVSVNASGLEVGLTGSTVSERYVFHVPAASGSGSISGIGVSGWSYSWSGGDLTITHDIGFPSINKTLGANYVVHVQPYDTSGVFVTQVEHGTTSTFLVYFSKWNGSTFTTTGSECMITVERYN